MITSRMIRLVSLLCLFVLCLGVGACAPAEQAVPTPGATVIMVPPSGLPGTGTTIYGSGFQEGEEINLEVVNAKMAGGGGEFGIWNVHTGPKPSEVVASASGAWSSVGWKTATAGEQSGFLIGIVPGVYTLRCTGNKGTVATTPYIVLEPKKEEKK